MTSFRRLAIPVVGLTLALAGGATMWLTGAGAAVPSAKLTPPGPQPNGVNFTIHSDVDTSYCVMDRPAPAQPASEASMTQCSAVDDQHWTFAKSSDGSVVLIGGSQGECLDFTAKSGSFVSVVPCTFHGAEHFFYTPSGQIESTSGKKCLQTNAATQDAELYIQKCQAGVNLQVWVIGH